MEIASTQFVAQSTPASSNDTKQQNLNIIDIGIAALNSISPRTITQKAQQQPQPPQEPPLTPKKRIVEFVVQIAGLNSYCKLLLMIGFTLMHRANANSHNTRPNRENTAAQPVTETSSTTTTTIRGTANRLALDSYDYIVDSPEALQNITKLPDGGAGMRIGLTTNIDASNISTIPLLKKCTLDGRGFSIHGLKSTLFHQVENANISNLEVMDAVINSQAKHSAVLAIYMNGGATEDVHFINCLVNHEKFTIRDTAPSIAIMSASIDSASISNTHFTGCRLILNDKSYAGLVGGRLVLTELRNTTLCGNTLIIDTDAFTSAGFIGGDIFNGLVDKSTLSSNNINVNGTDSRVALIAGNLRSTEHNEASSVDTPFVHITHINGCNNQITGNDLKGKFAWLAGSHNDRSKIHLDNINFCNNTALWDKWKGGILINSDTMQLGDIRHDNISICRHSVSIDARINNHHGIDRHVDNKTQNHAMLSISPSDVSRFNDNAVQSCGPVNTSNCSPLKNQATPAAPPTVTDAAPILTAGWLSSNYPWLILALLGLGGVLITLGVCY